MKSSSGVHHVALDHVRALAVFVVFTYHFLVGAGGRDAPLDGAADFFGNALLTEGHTGVAIFMTLSGYLFARLTEGHRLDFAPFFRNRLLRLGPLLALVLAIRLAEFRIFDGQAGFEHGLRIYMAGFVYPTWPNGGWSIATELHFYLLLPVLLAVMGRDPRWLLLIVSAALLGRYAIWVQAGGEQLKDLTYWTLVGRIDQFVVGMLAARCGGWLAGRHWLAAGASLVWLFLWSEYARAGGFHGDREVAWVWIGLPTCEAVAYGLLIAWYDRSFSMPADGISGLVAKIGQWSFAIYLLHFFYIGPLARFAAGTLLPTQDFLTVLLLSLPCFALTAMVGWAVHESFEKRFLRSRSPYLRSASPSLPQGSGMPAGERSPA